MPNNQRLNKVTSGRHVKRDGFVHVVKPRVPQNPDDDEQTHQKTIDPVVPQLPPAPTPTPSTSTTSSTSTSTSPTPTTTSTSSTTSSTSSITSTSSTSTSTSTSTSSSTSSSSTSTSTSSSTSTSTSTSTTSSTPAQTTQLVTNTSAALPTTQKAASTVVSSTIPAIASASATETSSPDDSSVSGAMIGGIAGAVGGLALIAVIVLYFLRKRKSDEYDDSSDFNAEAFKRQSVMLPDEDRSSRRGPRPPTMIERHIANNSPAPMSFGYNQSFPPTPGQYGQGPFGNQYQVSFNPGEVVSPHTPSPPPMAHSPYTPNTSQPFFGQYAQSPIASPMTPVGYNNVSQPPPVLSRQPSGGPRQPMIPMTPAGDDQHYVNLDRSSVTPFQAQQYEELSRRLGPQTADDMAGIAEEPDTMPAPFSKEKATPLTDPDLHSPGTPAPPYSDYDPSGQDLLVQPEPAHTNHSRVPSSPPLLPEIELHNRPFSPMSTSYDFPTSAKANSFDMPSPIPEMGPSAATRPPPSGLRNVAAKRPDTVYDTEDAYDGI